MFFVELFSTLHIPRLIVLILPPCLTEATYSSPGSSLPRRDFLACRSVTLPLYFACSSCSPAFLHGLACAPHTCTSRFLFCYFSHTLPHYPRVSVAHFHSGTGFFCRSPLPLFFALAPPDISHPTPRYDVKPAHSLVAFPVSTSFPQWGIFYGCSEVPAPASDIFVDWVSYFCHHLFLGTHRQSHLIAFHLFLHCVAPHALLRILSPHSWPLLLFAMRFYVTALTGLLTLTPHHFSSSTHFRVGLGFPLDSPSTSLFFPPPLRDLFHSALNLLYALHLCLSLTLRCFCLLTIRPHCFSIPTRSRPASRFCLLLLPPVILCFCILPHFAGSGALRCFFSLSISITGLFGFSLTWCFPTFIYPPPALALLPPRFIHWPSLAAGALFCPHLALLTSLQFVPLAHTVYIRASSTLHACFDFSRSREIHFLFLTDLQWRPFPLAFLAL